MTGQPDLRASQRIRQDLDVLQRAFPQAGAERLEHSFLARKARGVALGPLGTTALTVLLFCRRIDPRTEPRIGDCLCYPRHLNDICANSPYQCLITSTTIIQQISFP